MLKNKHWPGNIKTKHTIKGRLRFNYWELAIRRYNPYLKCRQRIFIVAGRMGTTPTRLVPAELSMSFHIQNKPRLSKRCSANVHFWNSASIIFKNILWKAYEYFIWNNLAHLLLLLFSGESRKGISRYWNCIWCSTAPCWTVIVTVFLSTYSSFFTSKYEFNSIVSSFFGLFNLN